MDRHKKLFLRTFCRRTVFSRGRFPLFRHFLLQVAFPSNLPGAPFPRPVDIDHLRSPKRALHSPPTLSPFSPLYLICVSCFGPPDKHRYEGLLIFKAAFAAFQRWAHSCSPGPTSLPEYLNGVSGNIFRKDPFGPACSEPISLFTFFFSRSLSRDCRESCSSRKM